MEEPFDPMKYIWNQVSETSSDGKHSIKYRNQNDLKYLYATGFVDTNKFTLPEWIDAFKDSLQKDQTYLLSEAQWMKKRKYRYEGPIAAPFDPMEMKEGVWGIKDFEELVKKFVLPSVVLPEKSLQHMLKGNLSQIAKSDKIQVSQPLKAALKRLLDTYPSPQRHRELDLKKAKAKMNIPQDQKATAEVKSKAQLSSFIKTPSASKSVTDQLKKLLGKG